MSIKASLSMSFLPIQHSNNSPQCTFMVGKKASRQACTIYADRLQLMQFNLPLNLPKSVLETIRTASLAVVNKIFVSQMIFQKQMSIALVASGLLILAGLTWLGNGLLNFSESNRQFCDLYCSLTDILPKEAVNVLFVLLGVLALGIASFSIYQCWQNDKKVVEPQRDVQVEPLKVDPVVVAEPVVIEKVQNDDDLETLLETDNRQPTTATRQFKTGGCCGR